MTKTLKQIQEENQEALWKLYHVVDNGDSKISDQVINLNKILFALGDGFKCKVVKDHSPDNNVYLWIYNYNVKILWDLTELTLEDQTEEAQRAVNELLGEK